MVKSPFEDYVTLGSVLDDMPDERDFSHGLDFALKRFDEAVKNETELMTRKLIKDECQDFYICDKEKYRTLASKSVLFNSIEKRNELKKLYAEKLAYEYESSKSKFTTKDIELIKDYLRSLNVNKK